MQAPVLHIIQQNHLWLSAERCLFWEEEKTLIASDLHFGKTGHFRKSGIPVPQSLYKEDLQRLFFQIQYFQPQQFIIVGDLFHSNANKELDLFLKWRNDLAHLNIQLIKGNHDILQPSWYEHASITVHQHKYHIGSFCFTHDVKDADGIASASYFFTGHIHPGIRINGLSKQALKFPCFHFTNNYAVLPAFSRFTGIALIEKKRSDKVFAIVEKEIVEMK